MLRIGAWRYAFLTLLGVCLLVQTAHAQSKSAVVVIDSGTADLFIESLVRTNAETELTKQGFTIVEGAAVGGETPTKLLACAGDLDCSVATLKGIAAEHVIFISLRSEADNATNFKIVVRDYEVATGKVLNRTMRRCPECKEEVDLAIFTEQLIVDLLKADEPAQPDPPVEVLPPTEPVKGSVPVPVYQPAVGGDVAMQKDESSLLKNAKFVGLGAGLAALATGTYLILIDGPVIEDGVRQPEANDTLTGGFLSLGAGVALVGVSAWLWSQEKDDASTRTSLVPTRGGGAVVWTGGF